MAPSSGHRLRQSPVKPEARPKSLSRLDTARKPETPARAGDDEAGVERPEAKQAAAENKRRRTTRATSVPVPSTAPQEEPAAKPKRRSRAPKAVAAECGEASKARPRRTRAARPDQPVGPGTAEPPIATFLPIRTEAIQARFRIRTSEPAAFRITTAPELIEARLELVQDVVPEGGGGPIVLPRGAPPAVADADRVEPATEPAMSSTPDTPISLEFSSAPPEPQPKKPEAEPFRLVRLQNWWFLAVEREEQTARRIRSIGALRAASVAIGAIIVVLALIFWKVLAAGAFAAAALAVELALRRSTVKLLDQLDDLRTRADAVREEIRVLSPVPEALTGDEFRRLH